MLTYHPANQRPSPWRGRLGSAALLTAALAIGGCDGVPTTPQGSPSDADLATSQGQARGNANVVEVVATSLHFDAPDFVPAGWTTFRFRNQTGGTHFVILEKMPFFEGEQKTVEDSQAEVVPVFQNFMDLFAGVPLSFPAAGLALPAWYPGVVFTGGPGLIAPGRTAETTVFLEPGTYVMECYVKTNGVFHSVDGMIDQIVVTDEPSQAREPRSTLRVRVSTGEGIEVEGSLRPGQHTIAVHFADQAHYSHFLGHDVHLARLEDDTDLNALGAWMNWAVPGELETPAPAAFLGGVQDMPAGSTGYFDVLLRPGRYAFIAEVPGPAGVGMLQTFTIP
jgi:hypothetical protein